MEYQVILAWREGLGNVKVRGHMTELDQMTHDPNVSKDGGGCRRK